ncbi:MAG: SpoIID/LytB domain-containing protein [Bacteroidia bacterium]|nr:SpoIID/LytB domain-containing protein [Bacteroidia bacterium]
MCKHSVGIVALLLLGILFASCAGPGGRARPGAVEPSIRVCLSESTGELLFEAGSAVIVLAPGRRAVFENPVTMSCSVNDDGRIELRSASGDTVTVGGALRMYTKVHDGSISFEKREYSDTLLLATDGERLYLINILPLERYLYGVLPNEIGRNRKPSDIAAVEAQAILARTYALNKIRLPLTRLFDVYDDARDQVFSGKGAQDPTSTAAVQKTRGLVVTQNGQPAECYYHSTCGGSTEHPSNVWSRHQSAGHLTGIRDKEKRRSFCAISPSFRWTEIYTRSAMENVLRTWLPSANEAIKETDIPGENWYLLDINLLKRSQSGRVTTVQIVMGNRAQQRSYYVHADRIRRALRRPDGTPLRSTLFDIHLERNAQRWISLIRIDGGGNGHGVGMCQWGAISRSREGQSPERILQAYFPGTRLRTMY